MERINKLKEFLKATPNDAFLQHALALEYVKLGQDEEAKLHFENILNNEPTYVGTYYHLAKLYERFGNLDAAITTYKNGMQQAKIVKDNHSYNELMMALEDLED